MFTSNKQKITLQVHRIETKCYSQHAHRVLFTDELQTSTKTMLETTKKRVLRRNLKEISCLFLKHINIQYFQFNESQNFSSHLIVHIGQNKT